MPVIKENKRKILEEIIAKGDAVEEMYAACEAIVRDFEDENDPLIIPASSCIHVPNHTDLCPYWLAKQALAKVGKRRQEMGEKSPYVTVGFGMGGYYAVKRVWYEKDKMWDNCQTGSCVRTRGEAVIDATEWAKAEGIECHA